MPTALRAEPQEYLPILRRHPQYDTPAKRANFARLIDARDAGRLVVDTAPSHLLFEPHASCNLRCCWAQRNPKHPGLRPRGPATLDVVDRLLDEVGEALYNVRLGAWGEPTMNRELPDIIRAFHDANVSTVVYSNMTLVDRGMAEALVASGLDEISASIDGVAQQSYEKYRVLGRVDRALAGLKEVIEARRRAGSDTPRIVWQFLVFEHNQHEWETAKRLADDLGVDVFSCFGASGRQWSPDGGLGDRVVPPRPEILCDDPWLYCWVDWDGAVHLCCRAFKAEDVMGHMNDAPLREIFDNERFQLARRVIRDQYVPGADERITCTGCNRVKDYVPEIAALGHTTTLG